MSDTKTRKAREVRKTPFMVAIVQCDMTLKVVSSGHSDLIAAEKWIKNEATKELDLNGQVEFMVFHAKSRTTINLGDSNDQGGFDDVVDADQMNSPIKPLRTENTDTSNVEAKNPEVESDEPTVASPAPEGTSPVEVPEASTAEPLTVI